MFPLEKAALDLIFLVSDAKELGYSEKEINKMPVDEVRKIVNRKIRKKVTE